MKRPSFRSRHPRSAGFTLIELLVVIGIIAILASVLFPVVTSSINAAKRSRASVMANQIQTSVTAYFTEYSTYPLVTQTTPADVLIGDTSNTDGNSWAALDCVLCGNVHPSTGASYTPASTGPTNTRAITFMTLKVSDVFANGSNGVQDAPKNPLPSSTAVNGANAYFNIAMDGDYDGVLGTSPSAVTTMPNFSTTASGTLPYTGGSGGTSTAGVAVWANCNGSTTGTNPAFWVHTY